MDRHHCIAFGGLLPLHPDPRPSAFAARQSAAPARRRQGEGTASEDLSFATPAPQTTCAATATIRARFSLFPVCVYRLRCASERSAAFTPLRRRTGAATVWILPSARKASKEVKRPEGRAPGAIDWGAKQILSLGERAGVRGNRVSSMPQPHQNFIFIVRVRWQ